jgi:heavy metal sensor kinase
MGKRQGWDFRLRLVAWYTLLSGLTLLVFDAFLYFQFREGLQKQIDQTLEVAALQAINNIDDEHGHGAGGAEYSQEDALNQQPRRIEENQRNGSDPPPNAGVPASDLDLWQDYDYSNGYLTFDPRRDAPALARQLDEAGVSVYLLDLDGNIRGHFGRQLTVQGQDSLKAGFSTRRDAGERWRIYTRAIPLSGDSPRGWIKVAHSLTSVDEATTNLRRQMLLGVPIVLALLGIGGFILANRALRPLAQITRTAQRVHLSGDLSQRINYQGAEDELGRLAIMFDDMLHSLQQTFEREQRFNADVSHELRTPLTAMKGRLSVALSQSRSAEDYEATLKAFDQEVDRLIRLSSDLLLLSRLEQGSFKGEAEQLDLGELLGAIADQVQPLADLKAVHVHLTVSPNLIVQAQPDHLIRLFLNLLDNAIKHTSDGGKVTLAARQVNHQVRVTISDTGCGIPADHLQHLFERFYRVESDRSRQTGGAGLGLAIACEIAQLYGGSIAVESLQNVGTTFIVTLPLANSLILSR